MLRAPQAGEFCRGFKYSFPGRHNPKFAIGNAQRNNKPRFSGLTRDEGVTATLGGKKEEAEVKTSASLIYILITVFRLTDCSI